MALFPSLRNRHGFFSDYWLGTVFGRVAGRQRTLVTRDVETAWRAFARIRERAEGRATSAAEVRERLARPLLGLVFGYHLGAPADSAPDRSTVPLYASAEDEAAGRPPLLLCYVGEWDEDLDAGPRSPTRRLADALARAAGDLRYGLLLTGERLRLVRRAGEGPRGAYLELALDDCLEAEDRESFAAALRLLSAATFRLGPDGRLPIDEIERESREHAERVSDELKRAVFQSAETLVQALLDEHAARDGGVGAVAASAGRLAEFRDAALTCLYRLLFILYAEARDPRLLAHPLYRHSYSLDELVRDLLRVREDFSDNRSGLWQRLLALFAIHDRGLPGLDGLEPIPARGGELFSPGTAAGRLLEEARLSDRTVARVLLDLTTTPPRRGVGREQVSFRELDIEQLGAIYEGLLEYEPRVAGATMIEVRVQGRTFALTPGEVVRLVRKKNLLLRGDIELVAGTEAEALHPEAAEAGEEAEEDDAEGERNEADEAPEEEESGLRRGAAALLLRRLEPGRFHFVPGPGRKGSGSFYTPLPLVRDLVRHALGPLVEGKRAPEIEALRVLDPACGSAHFLVEAMRFLARALHRAYVEEHDGKAPPQFHGQWDPHWRASDEEARAAGSEARAWCKRRIAERCLFGVDLNPTAVELARVSLWIESLAGDRPLTYFAHHLRCGNSLLGTWLDRLGAPPLPDMGPERRLFPHAAEEQIRQAAAIRRLIDVAADTGAVEPDSLEELRFKEEQRRKAEAVLADARLLFDLRSASAFVPAIWDEWETLVSLLGDGGQLEAHARARPWWERFEEVRRRERFFHWELEFPEVFLGDRPGFDVVLSNPPWDKVLPTKYDFYSRVDVLIRAFKGNDLESRIQELHRAIPGLDDEFQRYRVRTTTLARLLRQAGDFPLARAQSQAAHEDLSKYFVDRAARLVAEGGAVGMVVPSVLYNGDGAVGLREFLLERATIERFYAFENRKKIFPIDSRYKFVNLVFRKGAPMGDGFAAAFMRRDLAELDNDGPKPWMIRITRREIERLSPQTKAFLEYRSRRDQEIVRIMHEGRPTLGGPEPGAWGVTLESWRAHRSIFNSAEDKDLWTDPATGRLHSPQAVLGREPLDPEETIQLMREQGFWPVFEGKHVDQYLYGIKPIRWWLSVEQARDKYGEPPREEPVLVYRETASNTNERTCIAAVLPARSAAAHTLSGVIPEAVHPEAASTVLNSFCFDYVLRLRTAGTHVSFTYIQAVAVPPAAVVNQLPRIPSRPAWRAGMQNVTDDKDLWPLIWQANRAVAEAYGLGPDDFAHILASFFVFARKRPLLFAYLQTRLAEWWEESGTAGRRAPSARGAPPLARVVEPPSTYGERESERGTPTGPA